ncbi:MAG: RluA family pseudouridine synthase [Deltaproteobacteria bacterium]|nr:RluA family pseudouridine synthase [Deltaproteobacteria bacterium]
MDFLDSDCDSDEYQFTVSPDNAGTRLDNYLSVQTIESTRSQVKQYIEKGCVSVNGKISLKSSYKIKESDCITLNKPALEPLNAFPEDIPLDIRYEDEDVIVLVKPRGMVVHPAPGHPGGTLVNGLVHMFAISVGDSMRPGLVHRLDKDTSGLMVVAKTEIALRKLVVQFQEHTVDRVYNVLVAGSPPEFLELSTFHNRKPNERKLFSSRVTSGKVAKSTIKTIEYFKDAALISVTLHTGRTHQVRVHCFDNGFPVLGDPVYTPKHLSSFIQKIHKDLNGQALHAGVLGFDHPVTGQRMYFEAEPPEIFNVSLEKLRAQ